MPTIDGNTSVQCKVTGQDSTGQFCPSQLCGVDSIATFPICKHIVVPDFAALRSMSVLTLRSCSEAYPTPMLAVLCANMNSTLVSPASFLAVTARTPPSRRAAGPSALDRRKTSPARRSPTSGMHASSSKRSPHLAARRVRSSSSPTPVVTTAVEHVPRVPAYAPETVAACPTRPRFFSGIPPLEARAAHRPCRSTATAPIVSRGPSRGGPVPAVGAGAGAGAGGGSTRRRLAFMSVCVPRRRFATALLWRTCRSRAAWVTKSSGAHSSMPCTAASSSAPCPTTSTGNTSPPSSSRLADRATAAASAPGVLTRRTAATAPSNGAPPPGPGDIIAPASHSTSPCSLSAEPRPVLVSSHRSSTSTAAAAIARASPPVGPRATANPAAQALSHTFLSSASTCSEWNPQPTCTTTNAMRLRGGECVC
eukprot:m.224852 g.224852  ORF g.224852 m.224852 type:complete len:423 (-) comp25891_c0_seq5:208-1476(-)